jgi:hypothetical protein
LFFSIFDLSPAAASGAAPVFIGVVAVAVAAAVTGGAVASEPWYLSGKHPSLLCCFY